MIVSRNDKRVKVPACGQHTKDTHTHTHTPWLANWSHLQLCKERAISTLHGIERCWLIQIHGILNFCPLYLCLKTVRHVARGDRVLVVRTSGLHSKPDLYVCVLEQVYCLHIRAHFCQLWASGLLLLLQLQHGKHFTALQNLWEDTGVQHVQQVVLGWVTHFVFCPEVRKASWLLLLRLCLLVNLLLWVFTYMANISHC